MSTQTDYEQERMDFMIGFHLQAINPSAFLSPSKALETIYLRGLLRPSVCTVMCSCHCQDWDCGL